MSEIIDIAKQEFLKTINEYGKDPFRLSKHVNEVSKWAKYMTNKYKDADEEVVILSAWLHDIGHYPLADDVDHAVRGEERARKILVENNYPKEKMNKVLHCVRAHRCRDVKPNTLEAKIIAFMDSASHITDSMYYDMIIRMKETGENTEYLYGKMERDLKDLDLFVMTSSSEGIPLVHTETENSHWLKVDKSVITLTTTLSLHSFHLWYLITKCSQKVNLY